MIASEHGLETCLDFLRVPLGKIPSCLFPSSDNLLHNHQSPEKLIFLKTCILTAYRVKRANPP